MKEVKQMIENVLVLVRKENDVVVQGSDIKVGEYVDGSVVFTKCVIGNVEMDLGKDVSVCN